MYSAEHPSITRLRFGINRPEVPNRSVQASTRTGDKVILTYVLRKGHGYNGGSIFSNALPFADVLLISDGLHLPRQFTVQRPTTQKFNVKLTVLTYILTTTTGTSRLASVRASIIGDKMTRSIETNVHNCRTERVIVAFDMLHSLGGLRWRLSWSKPAVVVLYPIQN